MRIERESAGYKVRFLEELRAGEGAPGSIPFEVEGPPALVAVQFRFHRKGAPGEAAFLHAFSAPIQRPGVLYSFPARKTTGGRPLLRGRVDLPPGLRKGEPCELDVEVQVENLHGEGE